MQTSLTLRYVGGCQTPPTGNAPASRPQNTLYQTGTFSALQAGHYDGAEMAGALKTRGNLGVGTFDTLDGEMVMLDGQIYQIRDSGAAVPAADSLKLAYGLTTNFNPTLTRELSATPTLDALKVENVRWAALARRPACSGI